MLDILSNRTWRHLFLAQVTALFGTGLATVALGLLAWDLAGENGALVLGAVFTVKMVAYVFIGPPAGALVAHFPRRALLIALDLVRAIAALGLLFVTEIWQIFVLIFVLQSASAIFTPTFQAIIPEILPDDADYTRALSLSRLAYDFESLLSPLLAALLLGLVSFNLLFIGTVTGFMVSALLVGSVMLPNIHKEKQRDFWRRVTNGSRIYLNTPRLRGLMGLNLAVASAGAMVLVNTVVLVRSDLGLPQQSVAWVLAVYGCGSMLAALAIPSILDHIRDRTVMMTGAAAIPVALIFLAAQHTLTPSLLGGTWFVLGMAGSAVLTPSGRLLKRSAKSPDLPQVFAAQFALSHGCWLVTYPLSGWLLTAFGTVPTLIVLAALCMAGLVFALCNWRADEPTELFHTHDDLPPDHPHLRGHRRHSHRIIIDDLHPHWPRQQA